MKPPHENSVSVSFPLYLGRCEKIDSVLFRVIPAKAGIHCFQGLTN
jgi:hypothetical protein